ncbi:hypothetical protein GCM10020001_007720 [Nonomuraea salmonea]
MARSPLAWVQSPWAMSRLVALRPSTSAKPSSRWMPPGVSIGPVIMAMRLRPRPTKYSVICRAPSRSSAAAYGMTVSRPMTGPHETAGGPVRKASSSGSPACVETSSTPSAWPPRT